MKKTPLIILCLITFSLQSCLSIFIPRTQTVNVNTNNDSTSIFIDNIEVVKGTEVTKTKVQRCGAQVVLQTPGYKDEYVTMKPVPHKKPIAYWPLMIIDIPLTLVWGMGATDIAICEADSYQKQQTFNPSQKYSIRTDKEKYVSLSSIKFDMENYNKDIEYYNCKYNRNNQIAEFESVEKKNKEITEKKEAEEKEKKKKKKFVSDEKTLKFDDNKLSTSIYNTLKKTAYIDTVNKVFLDNNNTILLEGNVQKIKFFQVRVTSKTIYNTCRANMKWYLKNTHNEILDSTFTEAYSGEFSPKSRDNSMYVIMGDAVDNSYLKLKETKTYAQHIPYEGKIDISDSMLTLSKPNFIVNENSDAVQASVIIKRKDKGHGSGFAITNDGYLLTNYHVIAGKYSNKQSELTAVLPNGEEVPIKIIRFNKMTDVALLKVEHNFEKAFFLSPDKSFKNLQDIYTIGTPKSIELGQSISIGILSNERKVNKLSYLQLNMSVNGGNSGGPLFDKTGSLHGIVTSKLIGENTEGVCFGVPSYLVPKYLNVSYR